MEPLHSIIIPVRDRHAQLVCCLWSLLHSWYYTDKLPYEVVVVDGGSTIVYPESERVRVIQTTPDTPFNKSRLLNLGIDNAKGELLTFLDADAIVCPQFMGVAWRYLCIDSEYTKVAYRVRYLTEGEGEVFSERICDYQYTRHFFDRHWEDKELAFEAYCKPHSRFPHHTSRVLTPIFGNSQQSIRRDKLGDIRFDEEYVGRGFEDIDFNMQIWYRYGTSYCPVFITDGKHGIYHVKNNAYDGHWGPGHHNQENRRRYFAKWSKKWRKHFH